MRTLTILAFSLLCNVSYTQDISKQLTAVLDRMQIDSQFRHSIISLYVKDGRGRVIYDKNSTTGLAPASCLKIITSTAAFELLGKDFRYKTSVWYMGKVENGVLNGAIYFKGSGDPTLGSWRYPGLKQNDFLATLKLFLSKTGIKKIMSPLSFENINFSSQSIPDGWIWQDIGNYYGAGVSSLNWHENQYDIILQAGDNEGDPAVIVEINPPFTGLSFENECLTGPKNSGDNAYIYLPINSSKGAIRGTIPLGEKRFSISGAVPDPVLFFSAAINNYLLSTGILLPVSGIRHPASNRQGPQSLTNYLSPNLDSMNYWFMKKSINLYGEAFVKAISFEKIKFGSTDSGINVIKNFWEQHGVERSELKIIDGSGLSPANRITTSGLVSILLYAKKQNWFSSFYFSLPEINGIKMKDGYINGVRSYAGYVKSRAGIEYTFSFIINNFDGNATRAREKMWKVLDVLK